MRKYIVLLVVLLVVAFFLGLVFAAPVGAAGGPYRKVVIPRGFSIAIQPIRQLPDGSWEEPNGVTAYVLEPWQQAIYMPLAGQVSPGGRLQGVRPGDAVLLHCDWGAEDKPLKLVVIAAQIIAAEDEERLVLDRVGGRVFALITYPPCNNVNQRLVVWAVADRRH